MSVDIVVENFSRRRCHIAQRTLDTAILSPTADLDSLQTHCSELLGNWSRIVGNDPAQPHSYVWRLLTSMPHEPAHTRVAQLRQWLAAQMTDQSAFKCNPLDLNEALYLHAEALGFASSQIGSHAATGKHLMMVGGFAPNTESFEEWWAHQQTNTPPKQVMMLAKPDNTDVIIDKPSNASATSLSKPSLIKPSTNKYQTPPLPSFKSIPAYQPFAYSCASMDVLSQYWSWSVDKAAFARSNKEASAVLLANTVAMHQAGQRKKEDSPPTGVERTLFTLWAPRTSSMLTRSASYYDILGSYVLLALMCKRFPSSIAKLTSVLTLFTAKISATNLPEHLSVLLLAARAKLSKLLPQLAAVLVQARSYIRSRAYMLVHT